MEIKDIQSVYFVGAGGIGMSAIARYFINRGMVVAGYDKTPSDLTRQLEKEGMLIHYKEDVNEIPQACRQPKSCMVIYTPAIPEDHKKQIEELLEDFKAFKPENADRFYNLLCTRPKTEGEGA